MSPIDAAGNRVLSRLVCAALFGLMALGACSKDEVSAASAPDAGASSAAAPQAASESAPAVTGAANRNGSALAYEHDVTLRIPPAKIPRNMAAVREACISERLGTCSLLGEDMTAGESPFGNMQMRVEPKAVQGLVAMAADGGDVGQRATHAEDLADAVQSNGLEHQRLLINHQKLTELLARKDLRIEDAIQLNERLAQLEAGLQASEQETAQQQRRIQTNLLTLHFNAAGLTVDSSRIPQAFRGLGDNWDSTIATLITVLGSLLPIAVLVGLVWGIVVSIRRRRPRPAPPA